MGHHLLTGSDRKPVTGAKAVGDADPTERLEVSVLLRRSNGEGLVEKVKTLARGQAGGRHLTRKEFAQQYGAAPADIAAVRKFAGAHGLAVVQEHAGRRTVILAGTVAQFNDAFGVSLQRFEHPGGSYRGRVGSVQLPDELHGIVEAVLGLDDRPIAKPHFRKSNGVQPHDAAQTPSYTPSQVATLYGFPARNGQGQCVAIIELGGGERPGDLTAYFSEIGTSGSPTVTVVSVDHAKNHPTTADSADGEVMLDIEVVGGIAPAVHIAVYFAPNTDAGFLDAITTAIHDTTNQPSVISISWGSAESGWTQQSMTAFDSGIPSGGIDGHYGLRRIRRQRVK